MAKIPYAKSDLLNSHMPFCGNGIPARGGVRVHPVLAGALDVLLRYDGIGRSVQWIYGADYDDKPTCRPGVLERVLVHVTKRTLPYCKALEFIRISEIMNGMPTLGIAGLKSPRTNRNPVTNALRFLHDNGLLVKLKLPQPVQTPLYGLHLLNIISITYSTWLEELTERLKDGRFEDFLDSEPSMQFLSGFGLLVALLEVLKQYNDLFSYLLSTRKPIKDLDALCRKLSTMRTSCERNNDCVEAQSDFDELWKIRNNRTKLTELWKEKDYPYSYFSC